MILAPSLHIIVLTALAIWLCQWVQDDDHRWMEEMTFLNVTSIVLLLAGLFMSFVNTLDYYACDSPSDSIFLQNHSGLSHIHFVITNALAYYFHWPLNVFN